MASTRLPGKHLKPIGGKPALSHLIERLQEFNPIIATGDLDNKELESVGRVAYGDPENIPKRHMQIATAHSLDAIVSVDGDDLLTSPTAVRDVIQSLQEGKELVRTEGLPYGMNVLWAYTTEMLGKSQTVGINDTGWGWIFPEPHVLRYTIAGAEKIRATLDYPEDLAFFRQVLTRCPQDILQDDTRLTEWIITHL